MALPRSPGGRWQAEAGSSTESELGDISIHREPCTGFGPVMSCGRLLLVPRDSEAHCSELRTLLLTFPTQILACGGPGLGQGLS